MASMIRPLSLYIGLRYTKAKKHNHFISFISLLSVLGIALGVLVLVTVLSVMNGFDEQIKEEVFKMVPQVTLSDLSSGIEETNCLEETLSSLSSVTNAQPYVSGQGLIQYTGATRPVFVMGINPSYADSLIELSNKVIQGSFEKLSPGNYGMVIGQSTAYKLGASVGDKIVLLTPELNWSIAGVNPRLKQFTIVGVYHASSSFGYDDSLVFINLKDSQTLYELGSKVTGYQLKLKDPYRASDVASSITSNIPSSMQVSDWTQQYGGFFEAIAMEKTMMFLILLLIIAVAIFNLVSMLVMLVNEKQSDIAILRTLGMSRSTVVRIFVIQGTLIGFVGTLLGVALGVLLSLHVTEVVSLLQSLLHMQFISADIYFLDYLPSKLQWTDVGVIASVTMLFSFLSTLYPAYKASKVQPAKALRYE